MPLLKSLSVHTAAACRKGNILGINSSLRHWLQFPNLFIAILSTTLCLKGSHTIGDGRIKNLRVPLFNDDLSIEPNFGRIHLSGQYL